MIDIQHPVALLVTARMFRDKRMFRIIGIDTQLLAVQFDQHLPAHHVVRNGVAYLTHRDDGKFVDRVIVNLKTSHILAPRL